MSSEEAVEGIVSETLETIDQTLDILEGSVERVVTITKNNPWVIAGAAVVGAGIGGLIAWKVTKKRMMDWHEEDLGEQLRMAQSFQARLARKDQYQSPEEAAQALIPDHVVDVVKTYQGEVVVDKVAYNTVPPSAEAVEAVPAPEIPAKEAGTPAPKPVERNVFTPANDPRDWDYKAEVAAREATPDKPYVISREEFDEDTTNDQDSYTYYEGDDVLVDSRDQVVEHVDRYVGDDNLTRFGHGSDDINIVFVRNDDLEQDFEIIRHPGHHAVEVLGLEPPEKTIKHSRGRGRRQWDG